MQILGFIVRAVVFVYSERVIWLWQFHKEIHSRERVMSINFEYFLDLIDYLLKLVD